MNITSNKKKLIEREESSLQINKQTNKQKNEEAL